MYALSVHQPWAWSILNVGKNVENRKWRTNHRGPLLVHASKSRSSYDAQDPGRWRWAMGVTLPPFEDLPTGTIVGLVDLVDCIQSGLKPESDLGKWADPNCWCWVLANPRPFPTPVIFRGGQRLFKVPDEVVPIDCRS